MTPRASGTNAFTPDDSEFCDSGGLRIHVQIWGSGRPIVLVHGWGVDSDRNWVLPGWVESLRASRMVVALDVRGHGLSDKPVDPQAYTYGAMSADVVAVLDHLDIARADFLGYSMGAFIGAYLLGHASDRLGAVVLAGIGDETDESAAAAIAIAAALRGRRCLDDCRPGRRRVPLVHRCKSPE